MFPSKLKIYMLITYSRPFLLPYNMDESFHFNFYLIVILPNSVYKGTDG